MKKACGELSQARAQYLAPVGQVGKDRTADVVERAREPELEVEPANRTELLQSHKTLTDGKLLLTAEQSE